jgi:4-carboxymuconolactone decarboxylase
MKHVVEFAYGDTYSRPDLEHRQRQLVTIGILAALGGAEPQLTVHVNAALNVGLTPTEIIAPSSTPSPTSASLAP